MYVSEQVQKSWEEPIWAVLATLLPGNEWKCQLLQNIFKKYHTFDKRSAILITSVNLSEHTMVKSIS